MTCIYVIYSFTNVLYMIFYIFCIFQALQFNRQCDDVEVWMDEVETQLASEDHGKDVTSVNALLKKHQVY